MADAKNLKNKPSIQITYCVEGGHLDIATSLAAAIKDKLGITAKLKKGHGGIFQVTMDGKVLYMKCACRPFPTAEEVIERAEVLIKTRNVSDDARQLDGAGTPSGPSSRSSCCG